MRRGRWSQQEPGGVYGEEGEVEPPGREGDGDLHPIGQMIEAGAG